MKRLIREADGAVVAEPLNLAETFVARFRGLMGKAGLEPAEGLWLDGTDSIHMMFMRFAIDVLFLGRSSRGPAEAGTEGEVLKICSNVRPWIGMAWCPRAQAAVELPAGRAERVGVQVGDRLVLEEAA